MSCFLPVKWSLRFIFSAFGMLALFSSQGTAMMRFDEATRTLYNAANVALVKVESDGVLRLLHPADHRKTRVSIFPDKKIVKHPKDGDVSKTSVSIQKGGRVLQHPNSGDGDQVVSGIEADGLVVNYRENEFPRQKARLELNGDTRIYHPGGVGVEYFVANDGTLTTWPNPLGDQNSYHAKLRPDESIDVYHKVDEYYRTAEGGIKPVLYRFKPNKDKILMFEFGQQNKETAAIQFSPDVGAYSYSRNKHLISIATAFAEGQVATGLYKKNRRIGATRLFSDGTFRHFYGGDPDKPLVTVTPRRTAIRHRNYDPTRYHTAITDTGQVISYHESGIPSRARALILPDGRFALYSQKHPRPYNFQP